MDEHVQNLVDKLFQDSLQSHREEPSMETWDKIENQLDEDDVLVYKTRARRRFRITAGILLVLSGISLFTLFYHKWNNDISVKNTQSRSGSHTLHSEVKSKDPGIHNSDPKNGTNSNNSVPSFNEVPTHASFNSSTISGINDFSASSLHPLNIEAPATTMLSIHIGKDGFASGQNIPDNLVINPERHSIKNRLFLTPYFLQEFAGYNLSDDDASEADGKEIENRERNVFSASIGFYINYRINKGWMVQSGISYSWSSSIIDSSKSFAVKDNSGNVQFKLNTISGYGYLQHSSPIQPAVGDSVLTAKAFSQLHYLTVPLILSYRIPINRFSLLVGAGVSVNLLTSAKVETKTYGPNISEDESTIPMKGLKNINFGILLKADLEYHINSKWGVDLIPCFKNALSPINMHSALSAYPYNFGIGAGISYRF